MQNRLLSAALLPLLLLLLLGAIAQAVMLSTAQKTETLNVHNRLRRSVSPSAANMKYLTWNTRLEELAQRAANRCIFEHNYGGDYAGLGENLYQGWRTNTTDIVTFFFMEKLVYNFTSRACNLPNVLQLTICGHYLQVVGATVSELGCGIADCGGKYLFVCEYDRLHEVNNVYTEGTPCSACPRSAGYCLQGLCVNGSLAQDSTLAASQGNATCSVVCKNCGSRVDNQSASPPVCGCSCPTGFGSDHCSVKSSGAELPTGCGVCASLGTPCQNGGTEAGGNASCSCQCQSNFTGPQCQLSAAAYTGAAHLKIRGSAQFCTGPGCVAVPVNSQSFPQQLWPGLRSALATEINNFCRSNATNFALCCPSSGNRSSSGGAITGSLLSVSDVKYVDFSLQTSSTGYLEVAVYAVPQSGNSLCSGTGRRRRAVSGSSGSSVSVSVLTASIAAGNSSISSSLGGLTVASVSEYKAVVDVMFGYSSRSSGGGGRLVGCWTALAVCLIAREAWKIVAL